MLARTSAHVTARAFALAVALALAPHCTRAAAPDVAPPPYAAPAPAASATPAPVTASEPAAADVPVPEIEVVGERPGPGLWRVTNGDRTLYVLGTFRPLPKKITWRSREVDEVLARAELLIPESPDVDADVGVFKAVKLYTQWRRIRKNADGAALADVLPPELYARFEALRQRHAPRSRDLLQLRPALAAAELWRDALERQGLELRIDVERDLRRRARRADVEIAKPVVKLEDPQGLLAELDAIPRDAEIACMAVTLDRIENDLANARDLANAWATGDVDLIREKEVWLAQQACFERLLAGSRLERVRRDFEAAWLDTAVQALATRRVALAIAPMSRLLGPRGALAELGRRGYGVEAP
jgi:uncharacterized protein YbaP (TraB family)